jgi:hypothetical protein
LKRAAILGQANAQYEYAAEYGIHPEAHELGAKARDLTIRWCRKAAAKGHVSALMLLAGHSAAPQDVIETILSRLRLRTCAARRCDAEDVHLSCVGCGQGMAITVPFSVSSSASQSSFPAQLDCQLLCPGCITRSHPRMLEVELS